MTSWRLLACASVAPALALLVACSSTREVLVDDGPDTDGGAYDSAPKADSGLGQLRFQPTESYSGFDGTHVFRVPVAVYDAASDLKVTAADPTAADVAATTLANPVNQDGVTDTGKYFMVTIKKAGTITLSASSGGKTVTTVVHATAYDGARWAVGQQRYTTGANGQPPCTDCHVNGQAVDHSPAALATSDDEKVAAVITSGISTAGFPIQGVDGGHRWTVTDAERDGLVTYLRALDPKGFK